MHFDIKKAEWFFLVAAGAVGLCYVFANYGGIISDILLPFALAAIFAHFLSPPAEYLSAKLHIPKNISCIFITLSFFAALFTVIYAVAARLAREISGLSGYAELIGGYIPQYIENISEYIKEKLPFLAKSAEAENGAESFLINGISELASSVTKSLTGYVSSLVPAVISFIPKFFIAAVITVVASCYFTADLKKIKRFILFQLPLKAKIFFSECRMQFFDTVSKYIGAYFSIAVITFAELFAGLVFIRREYAFLLALVITAVDILPVLGSGSVLIPWAIVEFTLGNTKSAVALLVLYVVISIVRQIIEPKILGSYMGLHPLFTLFAIYAGGKLMGIAGIFIFPVAAIVLKNLNSKNLLPIFKIPPEEPEEKIAAMKTKYRKYKKSERR